MTVKELIRILENMPEEAVVRTTDTYAVAEDYDPLFEDVNPEVSQARLVQFGNEPAFVHIG